MSHHCKAVLTLLLSPDWGGLEGQQPWSGASQSQENHHGGGAGPGLLCTLLTLSRVSSLGSSWPLASNPAAQFNMKCLADVCQVASTSIHAPVSAALASGSPCLWPQ